MTMLNANKMGKRRSFVEKGRTIQSRLSTIAREQTTVGKQRQGTLNALGSINRKSTLARSSMRNSRKNGATDRSGVSNMTEGTGKNF